VCIYRLQQVRINLYLHDKGYVAATGLGIAIFLNSGNQVGCPACTNEHLT